MPVRVQPGAKKPGIEEVGTGELRLRVKSPPLKGEANREAVKLLADFFSLPPSRVHIVKGHTSRLKLVCIEVGERELSDKTLKKYIRKG